MSTLIPATVGRKVWFHPHKSDPLHDGGPQPFDASIAYAWSDRMINISVADHNGVMTNRTSVALVQPGDEEPVGQSYCTWMPFQVGQAQSQQAGEAQKNSGHV